MFYLFPFILFLFGSIIGSFLNVVIFRYHTGRTVGGRSQCLACGKVLHWYELIPLASFVAQRARCRGCASAISWQYPLVEGGTGLLFALTWTLQLAPLTQALTLACLSLLVIITAYDIRHKIIPDHFVFAFIAIALLTFLSSLISSPLWPAVWPLIWPRLLATFGLFTFFFLLWYLSAGRWLGFGDAKLVIGLGLLLPWCEAVTAVISAFWLGAVVGLLLVALSHLTRGKHRLSIKSEVPFAPFIIAGLLLGLYFHLNVLAF